MYVSDGEVLIKEIEATRVTATFTLPYIDMTAGTSCLTPHTRDLFNYATANNFNYLILYGLAKKLSDSYGTNYTIAGNPAFNDALKAFLAYAQSNLIKVGAVVTNEDFLLNMNANGSIVNSTGVYYFSSSPFYYNFADNFTCDNARMASSNVHTGNIVAHRDSGGFGDSGGDDEIDTTQYIEDFYDDALVNPSDTSFRAVQLSEMLKQVYRIAKFSYQMSDWYNTIDKTSSTPPLSNYLFDYISIEFEYWNWSTAAGSEYLIYYAAAGNNNGIAQRNFWNNYSQVVYAVSGVCRHMCWYTRGETELVLRVPSLTSTTDPTLPLSIEDQAAFISSYLSRALLTSYTQYYQCVNGAGNAAATSVLDKTADAITTFAEVFPPEFMFSGYNPSNSYGFTNYFEVWPVFSAQTGGEQKHDFGVNNGSYWPAANYYGPTLASGIKMCEIEENYQNAFFGYDGGITSSSTSFAAIPLYNSNNSNHSKPYHYQHLNADNTYSYTLTGGFVWYNYMQLSNPNRTPANYSRLSSLYSESTEHSSCNINFIATEKLLKIEQTGTSYNSVELYDANGKLLIKQAISENSIIALNKLNAGFYLSKLSSPNNKPLLQKIIIIY